MQTGEYCVLYYNFSLPGGAGGLVQTALNDAGWTVSHVDSTTLNRVQSPRLPPGAGIIQLESHSDDHRTIIEKFIRKFPNLYWVLLSPRELLCRASLGSLVDAHCFFLPTDVYPQDVTAAKLIELVQQSCFQWTVRKPLSKGQYFSQHGILGNTAPVKNLLKKIDKIARTDAPILITGETGTGKELIAQAIVKLSHRSNKPFVSVNCGAIVPNLLQSELFGHEAGAFTGAIKQHIGFLEKADGGTLFLDEVAELPLEQQANLLRFLQDKKLHRVGGTRDIHVDVRIIAATHQDLESAITTQRFREDLYYRLAVLQIESPPLRARKGDIELLAGHYLSRFSGERGISRPGLSEASLAAMQQHDWPGNIRELINRVTRAAIMCESALIEPEDLGLAPPREIDKPVSEAPFQLASDNTLHGAKERAEAEAVRVALHQANQNITQASKKLGVSRATLYRLIDKYNIDRLA